MGGRTRPRRGTCVGLGVLFALLASAPALTAAPAHAGPAAVVCRSSGTINAYVDSVDPGGFLKHWAVDVAGAGTCVVNGVVQPLSYRGHGEWSPPSNLVCNPPWDPKSEPIQSTLSFTLAERRGNQTVSEYFLAEILDPPIVSLMTVTAGPNDLTPLGSGTFFENIFGKCPQPGVSVIALYWAE